MIFRYLNKLKQYTPVLSLGRQRRFNGTGTPVTPPTRPPPFPTLMDFPKVVWPSLILTAKNWFLLNLVIGKVDPDFNTADFTTGAKHAVQVISNALSQSDFSTLKNLVSKEAFEELQESVSKMSVSEREQLSIREDDFYFSFPHQIGMIMDDDDDSRRWVEITMVLHAVRGFKEITERGALPPGNIGLQPEYQQKLFICNYRFIRNYTKGVTDSWLVNIVNHFRLQDF